MTAVCLAVRDDGRCDTGLELEPGLGGELGRCLIQLVTECFEGLRIRALVVCGHVVSSVGYLAGEVGDASQGVLDGVLPLAPDGRERRELTDLLLERLFLRPVSPSSREVKHQAVTHWPSLPGIGDKSVPSRPSCVFCL